MILDASGSMWGQIEGENKIVIARRVLKELVGGLADDAEVGLVAYGHRREGDCQDVETVVPLARLDRAALGGVIDGLNPKGKTPITRAVEQAIEVVRGRGRPATVILVSDGLETCGGDPCAAVKAARQAGVDFIMHVVGFDVGEVDVAQLECAAQAGGGLYRSARSAGELAGALEQAVALPADEPPGTLSVKVIADGALQDATVNATVAGSGEQAAGGRTYASPETNPRVLPLADGTYDVTVKAVGMKGEVERRFAGIEIRGGDRRELVVDFSSGELAIGVTKNGGTLSDASVRVLFAGSGRQAAAGRTYASANTNPKVFRLTAGDYDVVVRSVEIAGKPEQRFEGLTVEPGGRLERSHEFTSGKLAVKVVEGEELVDAVVRVVDAASGKAIAQGRTYTAANSNPKRFEVPPGRYRLEARAVGLEGRPSRRLEVTVETGGEVEHLVDFAGGG
ncbi:MAG: VWA domain-containing protein [Acidobacteria bacterium]|nr:MAG: VWA domain-containing protein [Acidobacteriota bacterium]